MNTVGTTEFSSNAINVHGSKCKQNFDNGGGNVQKYVRLGDDYEIDELDLENDPAYTTNSMDISLREELKDKQLTDIESRTRRNDDPPPNAAYLLKKRVYSDSIFVRTMLDVISNNVNVFIQSLANPNSQFLLKQCNLRERIDKVVINNENVYVFVMGEMAMELIPITFCGVDEDCFRLIDNNRFLKMASGGYCKVSRNFLDEKICEVLEDTSPFCLFSLPSKNCKFETVVDPQITFLMDGSALLFPLNNTIIQNNLNIAYEMNGFQLAPLTSNEFKSQYTLLHYVFSAEQITNNHVQDSFMVKMFNKFKTMLGLVGINFGISGLLGSIVFGFLAKFLYNKCFKKPKRTNEPIELKQVPKTRTYQRVKRTED